MPDSQLLIWTAIPRALSLDPETVAVSVVVSPRLRGSDVLGSYPDWLDWTALRQQHGVVVDIACNGVTRRVELPIAGLRPDLWSALFNARTFVRSHTFDDYSEQFVSSYPVRTAAAALQATYQAAGLEFALPASGSDALEHGSLRRRRFSALVSGYGVGWSQDNGRKWRKDQIARQRAQLGRVRTATASRAPRLRDAVGEDGLVKTGAFGHATPGFATAQKELVEQFGVFSHVPPGAPVSETFDDDKVLDFHQALSALNAYPELLRLLGLVYDIELPLDFVAETGAAVAGQLSITAVDGHWNPDTITAVPSTSTAYMHLVSDAARLVAVAPRALLEPGRAWSTLGLLNLDPARFGLMQVDVDGGLHKAVMLADSVTQLAGESLPRHPEVFDPTTTLASLRSGGFSLFADARALELLDTAARSKAFNTFYEGAGPSPGPLCSEDVTRGYRLDVWDGDTGTWHSLHRKRTALLVGEQEIELTVEDSEGFFTLAATQAAPAADGTRPTDDLYLHEAMVRWSGWSLSAETVGKHLTRAADPDLAIPGPANPASENEPVTPFKLAARHTIVPGTLPRLRFGGTYRFRVRAVDLAGNGLAAEDSETELLTPGLSIPRGDGVVPYLRFEPVAAPAIVLRDEAGVTGEGSSVDRLVIRTYNTDPSLDAAAADLTAADRHIAPPRATVETAERHGMFDDADGDLVRTPAMWQLIKQRDAGEFKQVVVAGIVIDGEAQSVPVEPGLEIGTLPYLPDPLARAAALRDLPGSPPASAGRVGPGAGPDQPVAYEPVTDARPRPGSVTIVEFGGREDWGQIRPFRLALADGDSAVRWDPVERVLTVSLPKATTHVLPLSACPDPADLKYLGVWKWLKEYIDFVTVRQLEDEFFEVAGKDRIAHVLALAAEGGHGMLTPPHLLTLVHAVQQPIGRPQFVALTAQLSAEGGDPLQTQPESPPTGATELDVLQAWRRLGGTDAWLVGALAVHGASTAKVNLRAEWTDPVDDPDSAGPGEQTFSAPVDELPLPALAEGYVRTDGGGRTVGYYDADHDLICCGPVGTRLGELRSGAVLNVDAVPCHRIGDARHHVVAYSAVATSRYREYFPAMDGVKERDFTRSSDAVLVHVPASARPLAPQVLYVVPTFGWQREARSDQARSVRLGGGLRVYLDRPWYSSGAGELLGVALTAAGGIDREAWKAYITQWGQDPIWESAALEDFPAIIDFPDAVASEAGVSLDAVDPDTGRPRRIGVAGHEVQFDHRRKLWYCDLTVEMRRPAYAPFVRLGLVRYQPHALVDAKVSRVVLADFCQLTPERAATVTADPDRRGALTVVVSGPAPRGPLPARRTAAAGAGARPTIISVTVQRRDAAIVSDLAWSDATEFVVDGAARDTTGSTPDFILWTGSLTYTGPPQDLQPGRYRLLIQEHEILPADGVPTSTLRQRLVYAETLPLDGPLLTARPRAAASTAPPA